MTTPSQARYLDEKGREVRVHMGIGWEAAECWLTKRGCYHVKSRDLPIRDTQEEAENDLASYAAKRGWPRADAVGSFTVARDGAAIMLTISTPPFDEKRREENYHFTIQQAHDLGILLQAALEGQ